MPRSISVLGIPEGRTTHEYETTWYARIIGFTGSPFSFRPEDTIPPRIDVVRIRGLSITVDWYHQVQDIPEKKKITRSDKTDMLFKVMDEEIFLLGNDANRIHFSSVICERHWNPSFCGSP